VPATAATPSGSKWVWHCKYVGRLKRSRFDVDRDFDLWRFQWNLSAQKRRMAQQQDAVSDTAQAIAQAVTESFNRSMTTAPSRLDSHLRERISSLQLPRLESPPTPSNRTPGTFGSSSGMVGEASSVSGGQNSIGGTKRRFPPPTLFSRKRAKPAANTTKVISYVRDTICLPKD